MNTIIIEKDLTSRLALEVLIKKNFKNVKIIDTTNSLTKGIQLILQYKPQLVFLDIEFPNENGFQIFDFFSNPDFDIIFTNGNDSYAYKTLKSIALDYLIKPIQIENLHIAIQKVIEKKELEKYKKQWSFINDNLNNKFNLVRAVRQPA